jgi:hypothetical protein
MSYQAMLAATVIAMCGASATAGELPIYQVDGFVMTPHQQSVLTPSNARERLTENAFAYGSPHQIMVLSPRQHSAIAETGRPGDQPSNEMLIKVSR